MLAHHAACSEVVFCTAVTAGKRTNVFEAGGIETVPRIGEISRLGLNSVVNGTIVRYTTDFISLDWFELVGRRSSQSSNELTGMIGLLDFLTKPLEHFTTPNGANLSTPDKTGRST